MAAKVRGQGGQARVLPISVREPAEHQALVRSQQADRDVEYGEVVERVPQFLAEIEESEADLDRFRRWLASIAARDYFDAPVGPRRPGRRWPGARRRWRPSRPRRCGPARRPGKHRPCGPRHDGALRAVDFGTDAWVRGCLSERSATGVVEHRRRRGGLLLVRPKGPLLKEALRILPDVLRLLRRLTGDRNLPRGIRVRLALQLAYLAIPFDPIPDFLPVLGYADDAIIVTAILRGVVRRAGLPAVRAHWPGTDDGFAALARLTGLNAAVPGS
jgi:uncharacterized membrane protein YkvA (DUF1232 family)